jgi:hypothetical protein
VTALVIVSALILLAVIVREYTRTRRLRTPLNWIAAVSIFAIGGALIRSDSPLAAATLVVLVCAGLLVALQISGGSRSRPRGLGSIATYRAPQLQRTFLLVAAGVWGVLLAGTIVRVVSERDWETFLFLPLGIAPGLFIWRHYQVSLVVTTDAVVVHNLFFTRHVNRDQITEFRIERIREPLMPWRDCVVVGLTNHSRVICEVFFWSDLRRRLSEPLLELNAWLDNPLARTEQDAG